MYSIAVSIFVVILVELTNTVFVFVNSTNITTNIETAALSTEIYFQIRSERKKMAGESAHSRPESSSSQADEERDLPHVSEEKDNR